MYGLSLYKSRSKGLQWQTLWISLRMINLSIPHRSTYIPHGSTINVHGGCYGCPNGSALGLPSIIYPPYSPMINMDPRGPQWNSKEIRAGSTGSTCREYLRILECEHYGASIIMVIDSSWPTWCCSVTSAIFFVSNKHTYIHT